VADEPYKTLFWIVAETGIRGAEVCGLTVDCLNLVDRTMEVRRSAWRGKLQTPKTQNLLFGCFRSRSDGQNTLKVIC